MSTNDVQYQKLTHGNGFCAKYNGNIIGEIDIVYVGANRLIIESTQIDRAFENTDVCRNLVRCVADSARRENRKILSLCPRAQSIFNRYAEFDDVRLMKLAA